VGAARETNRKEEMMTRIKTLGLALVAVFALSAVVASAASAQNGRLTSTGPVTLDGVNTGAELENSLTAFGLFKVTCPNVLYTGHKVKVTPHEPVPSGAEQVTITPHYGVCSTAAAGSFPTTVDMNGCDYEFDLLATKAANEYNITPTVICPPTKHIELTIFTNAADHAANKPFCISTVTEKVDYPKNTLVARDTLNGHVDITGTVEEIEVHKAVGPDGGVLCPAATDKAAILHIDVTINGTNASKQPTSISLSHL
jgi:hypothetical protein